MTLEGSLILVAEVARALGDLLESVVFIGGAIAPVLHEDRPFRALRPTRDVDAIAMTVSYSDFDRMREELRRRGFRENINANHMHRWVTPGPNEIPFDLVPIGIYLAASGNPWDVAAMETSVMLEIETGLTIRHASAPSFLALKLAAFDDRGADDPFASADLEDIFALVASRPHIVEELSKAPRLVRQFVAEKTNTLVDREEFDDLIAGHLGSVARERAREVIHVTVERLRQIARIEDE